MTGVKIGQLQDEVNAAGFDIPLTAVGDEVFEILSDGSLIPVRPGIAALVTAHMPGPEEESDRDFYAPYLDMAQEVSPDTGLQIVVEVLKGWMEKHP